MRLSQIRKRLVRGSCAAIVKLEGQKWANVEFGCAESLACLLSGKIQCDRLKKDGFLFGQVNYGMRRENARLLLRSMGMLEFYYLLRERLWKEAISSYVQAGRVGTVRGYAEQGYIISNIRSFLIAGLTIDGMKEVSVTKEKLSKSNRKSVNFGRRRLEKTAHIPDITKWRLTKDEKQLLGEDDLKKMYHPPTILD